MKTTEVLIKLEKDKNKAMLYQELKKHTERLSSEDLLKLDELRESYDGSDFPEGYRDYLHSDYWYTFRNSFSKGKSCAICSDRKSQHCHHKHYNSLYSESDDSCIILCDKCHCLIHPFGYLTDQLQDRMIKKRAENVSREPPSQQEKAEIRQLIYSVIDMNMQSREMVEIALSDFFCSLIRILNMSGEEDWIDYFCKKGEVRIREIESKEWRKLKKIIAAFLPNARNDDLNSVACEILRSLNLTFLRWVFDGEQL